MHIDSTGGRRRRRIHSDVFKNQVIEACRRPGVSIAAVAIEHRLNANLVRRWLRLAEESEITPSSPVVASPVPPPATTLVPVTVTPAAPASSEIRIVVQRAQRTIEITWPLSHAAECVEALRELLR